MTRAFSYMQDTESISGSQLKIGEVSKRSGIGIEALRFYEKSGLLDRPGRTYSGYRLYDEGVLERLAFIKQAQLLGFALNEIKEIIAHKQEGISPCAEVREIVRMRLSELDERIKQMHRYRKELATTRRMGRDRRSRRTRLRANRRLAYRTRHKSQEDWKTIILVKQIKLKEL